MSRFFHHPLVLVAILLLCVGTLVWRFWPLGEEELFERGKAEMDKGTLYDMQRAWSDYLEPLEKKYPEHAYKDEVAEFRRRLEAAKAPPPGDLNSRIDQLQKELDDLRRKVQK